jgi:hypothetical protein
VAHGGGADLVAIGAWTDAAAGRVEDQVDVTRLDPVDDRLSAVGLPRLY